MADDLNIRGSDVLAEDIVGQARLTGPNFEMRPHRLVRQAVLHGNHRMTRLRPGLSVHTSDTVALQNMTTSIEQPPGITVFVFLSGQVDASIGNMQLDVGRADGDPVRGVMISRARPDRLVRYTRKGDRIRKVIVTASPDWIEECGFDNDGERETIHCFRDTHLSRFTWDASPALVSIAEQMLNPPLNGIYPANLYLESRALDMVGQAFAAFIGKTGAAAGGHLSPFDLRRLQSIEDNLATGAPKGQTIEQIARDSGVSASTMQRLFRAAHGMTATEYLRRHSLVQVRQMLERESITITEASRLAGYASAANFSTAFKREFGITPRQARKSGRW